MATESKYVQDSVVPEVLHGHPVRINKKPNQQDPTRNGAAVVLVVLDPVKSPVTSVWHQQLRYQDGIDANDPEGNPNQEQEDADNEMHLMRLILRLVYKLLHGWLLGHADTLVRSEGREAFLAFLAHHFS